MPVLSPMHTKNARSDSSSLSRPPIPRLTLFRFALANLPEISALTVQLLRLPSPPLPMPSSDTCPNPMFVCSALPTTEPSTLKFFMFCVSLQFPLRAPFPTQFSSAIRKASLLCRQFSRCLIPETSVRSPVQVQTVLGVRETLPPFCHPPPPPPTHNHAPHKFNWDSLPREFSGPQTSQRFCLFGPTSLYAVSLRAVYRAAQQK